MNYKRLYEMQQALDAHIEKKHGLEHEDLFDQKLLALLVETGELANETRCFKFWSEKPSSPQEAILEEFVDGIHFILSLGIWAGFTHDIQIPATQTEENATDQFLKVFKSINQFQTSRSEADYIRMFQSYLNLATVLGFSEIDIEKAYISKNKVNYERQLNGY